MHMQGSDAPRRAPRVNANVAPSSCQGIEGNRFSILAEFVDKLKNSMSNQQSRKRCIRPTKRWAKNSLRCRNRPMVGDFLHKHIMQSTSSLPFPKPRKKNTSPNPRPTVHMAGNNVWGSRAVPLNGMSAENVTEQPRSCWHSQTCR